MPISLKNMRGCASPAATAICTSTTDSRDMIRHSVAGAGTPRPMRHRLNSFLHDQYDTLTAMSGGVAAPCISELPITPRSLYRKSSSLKNQFSGAGDEVFARRRSAAEVGEYLRRRKCSASADTRDVLRRSPSGSSRYLLSDSASFGEDLEEYDGKLKKQSLALVPNEPVEEVTSVGSNDDKKYGYGVGRRDDLALSSPVYRRDLDRSRALVLGEAMVKPRYKGSNGAAADERNRLSGLSEGGLVKSSPLPARSGHQVVVLRVSLHCKGCEVKLRKHLTKMEGVASFSIDLETKKVTVVGDITPLDALSSISKVKNAQFWPSPSTSASSFSSSSS